MPTVALQQVTSPFARSNAGKTREKPIRLSYVTPFLDSDDADALRSACIDDAVYVWGSKGERVHQYEKMDFGGCLVLFRRRGIVFTCGFVARWAYNAELAERLWGLDEDGKGWNLVYFLTKVRKTLIPAREVNQLIGRRAEDHWQGFHVVESPASDGVIDYVRRWLDAHSK